MKQKLLDDNALTGEIMSNLHRADLPTHRDSGMMESAMNTMNRSIWLLGALAVALAGCGGDFGISVTGCVRTSCEQLGKDCDQIDDGCGNILQCGTCQAPDTCGGGGVAKVCGHDSIDMRVDSCAGVSDGGMSCVPNVDFGVDMACGPDGNLCNSGCTDSSCNNPPAPQCFGNTRRTYAANGTCSVHPDGGVQLGACFYPTAADTPCTTAPANADPICTGLGQCDFVCHTGYVKSGGSCIAQASNTWATVSNVPGGTGLTILGAVAHPDGNIYYIGQSNLGTYMFRYTPSTNMWSDHLAAMNTPRTDFATVLDGDGRIYTVGGIVGSNVSNVVETYSPIDDTWTTLAALPTARHALAAAVDTNGRIYAIGGMPTQYNNVVGTVEAYTIGSNSWTSVASLGTARQGVGAVLGSDNRIYAIGGADAGGIDGVVEAYNVSSNTWTMAASMPTSRQGFGIAVGADNRIYAIDGGPLGVGAVLEAYNLGTNTWTSLTAPPDSRGNAKAVSGPGGLIYFLGGVDYQSLSNATALEVYKP